MPTESAFVQILQTYSQTDLALIKSVLDAEGVQYYIKGENIGSIYTFAIPMILMVAGEDVQTAKELLEPLELQYYWSIFNKEE